MDAEKKRLRDEVAELAGAVRALRDELAIALAAHHGCHCVHTWWVYPNVVYPNGGNVPYQPYIPPVWVSSGNVTYSLSQGN